MFKSENESWNVKLMKNKRLKNISSPLKHDDPTWNKYLENVSSSHYLKWTILMKKQIFNKC